MEKMINQYLTNDMVEPLLLSGDSLQLLKKIPSDSVDCCMTSPPYWQKREYANGGIGL